MHECAAAALDWCVGVLVRFTVNDGTLDVERRGQICQATLGATRSCREQRIRRPRRNVHRRCVACVASVARAAALKGTGRHRTKLASVSKNLAQRPAVMRVLALPKKITFSASTRSFDPVLS